MNDGSNLFEDEPEYVPGPPKEELLAALERDKHDLPYRLILEFGTDFEPMCMPSDVEEGEPGHCFRNAFDLASESDSKLRYVEGYACVEGAWPLPYRHGWCIDESDCVIDPTWGTARKMPLALRGVILPLDLVKPFCGGRTRGALEGLDELGRFDEVLDALGIAWADFVEQA